MLPSGFHKARKLGARLALAGFLPFLLLVGVISAISGGSAAASDAACQAAASGATSGTPVSITTTAGAYTPAQVEELWIDEGGPVDAAVTAAAIANAESDDIPDRLQGSLTTAPEQATAWTPSDPEDIGWGLWQITPGSSADYNPDTNAQVAIEKYDNDLQYDGNGFLPWTTYTSGAYEAYMPAAEAAFQTLSTTTTQDAQTDFTSYTARAAVTSNTVLTTSASTSATNTTRATSGTSTASAGTIDTSSLNASEQAALDQAASDIKDNNTADCSNVSQSASVPTVSGPTAQISSTGEGEAPTGLPSNVQTVVDALIAAGNQIDDDPYIWGGGHGINLAILQAGYDCSGSTSYMLFKAGILGSSSPYALVSGDFNDWGDPGPGKYITIFSNRGLNGTGHVFIEVDGIVMDTAWYDVIGPKSPSTGPRWQPASMIQAQINGDIADGGGGFIETHPAGY